MCYSSLVYFSLSRNTYKDTQLYLQRNDCNRSVLNTMTSHLKRNFWTMVALGFLLKHAFQETSCYTKIYIGPILLNKGRYILMSQLGYFSGQLLGTQLRTEKETVKNLNVLNRYHKAHTLFTCVRPSGALLTYFKHNSYNSNCLAFHSLYLLFIAAK